MTPTSLESPRERGIGFGRPSLAWLSKRPTRVSLWTFALAFAIYRIATFTPQPLDGRHTLRPILNGWLDIFLRHYQHPESAYEDWRAFCLLALLIAPALAALNLVREYRAFSVPERAIRVLCSRGLLFASIAATLFICRYPTLIDYQLNPDEGQFLSAAHKLFYNGNYFDAVDCGTSGPLNIYPLMLPAIFGISPDYASSRILVLLTEFCAIYLLYRSIRLMAPDSMARIAILPFSGAFAVFENPNLVHYSSEKIPVLLVAMAFYFAVRVLRNPAAYRIPIFLLGLLASAAFFTKLQSVPIVVAIGAVAIAYLYASTESGGLRQPFLWFIAGVLPLQLANAAMCLAAGVWTNFWMSYIVTNQRYADVGTNFVTELPGLVTYFVENSEVGYFIFTFLAVSASYAFLRLRGRRDGERSDLLPMVALSAAVMGVLMVTLLRADAPSIGAYVVLVSIFMGLISFLGIHASGPFGTEPLRWFGLLSTITTGAAVFSVYRPHRTFPGYLLFLFLPLTANMAWMLIRHARESAANEKGLESSPPARLAFPLLVAILVLTYSSFVWGTRDPHNFRDPVATIRQPEGDFIRSLTGPEGQIFVWGWTVDPYLSSGRVTATRDLNVAYQFMEPREVSSYYRQRLLSDLSHNPPELIVDAISTNSWFMDDRAKFGLDQAPEIARFVNDFYRHIADAYGERFFLRADLMARAGAVKMPESCATAAVRCEPSPRRFYGGGVTTPVMDNLPAVKLPDHSLLEVHFTPFGRQTENATILNNEAAANSLRGFRLQNVGGDLYQLLLGVGDRWVFSKPIYLADGKPVRFSIEFSGTEVRIVANDAVVDSMHLPAVVADAPGPITFGSWINGACRFSGTIDFFQIVDLGNERRHPG